MLIVINVCERTKTTIIAVLKLYHKINALNLDQNRFWDSNNL